MENTNSFPRARKSPTPASVAADLKIVASKSPVEASAQESQTISSGSKKRKTLSRKTKKAFKKALQAVVAISLIAILVVTAMLIVKHFLTGQKQDEDSDGNYTLVGSWKSQAAGGSCYIFQENKEFFWLPDCTNSEQYYFGIYDSEKGDAALAALNTTLEKALKLLIVDEQKVVKDNIYAITLQSTNYIQNGINNPESSETRILFILEGSKLARAFRYDTGDSYTLTLNSEISTTNLPPASE